MIGSSNWKQKKHNSLGKILIVFLKLSATYSIFFIPFKKDKCHTPYKHQHTHTNYFEVLYVQIYPMDYMYIPASCLVDTKIKIIFLDPTVRWNNSWKNLNKQYTSQPKCSKLSLLHEFIFRINGFWSKNLPIFVKKGKNKDKTFHVFHRL